MDTVLKEINQQLTKEDIEYILDNTNLESLEDIAEFYEDGAITIFNNIDKCFEYLYIDDDRQELFRDIMRITNIKIDDYMVEKYKGKDIRYMLVLEDSRTLELPSGKVFFMYE